MSLTRGNPASTAPPIASIRMSIESCIPKSAPASTSLVSPPSSRWRGVAVRELSSVHHAISMAAFAKLLPLKTSSAPFSSAAVSNSLPTTAGPNTSVTWWNAEPALSLRYVGAKNGVDSAQPK